MQKNDFLKLINNGKEFGAKSKLAKSLGIKLPSVTDWFNGNNFPSEENIKKMSKLYDLDINVVREVFYKDNKVSSGNVYEKYIPRTPAITPEDYANMGAVPLTPSNTIKLPILADCPAGLPEFSDRDVEMFVDIPRFMFPGADFVVKCIGDSLEPEIKKGDFCVIRKMTDAIDSKPMLVKTPDGICMKIVRKDKEGKTWLCSLNPNYKPFIAEEITVIGLVMGRWNRTDRHNYHVELPER